MSCPMQSKPPAAGLGGEDEHVYCPGALLYSGVGEERCKLFWRNLHWLDKGRVRQEKINWRKFWDSCIVCKEELFNAAELVVSNSLESSCISRVLWCLEVSLFCFVLDSHMGVDLKFGLKMCICIQGYEQSFLGFSLCSVKWLNSYLFLPPSSL